MSVRSFAKSAVALLVVAGISYLLEVRLHHQGVPSRYLILLSNLLVGLVAAALVYVLSAREQQRQAHIECRLRVIAEMNHHIRNALQVITFYSRKGEKQEVGIVEAVERIQWALREILPQLPESMPARKENDRVLNIQKFRPLESSGR
ncbi:MAG TPA: hypothetical protein VG498_08000 [Terriglobales bacterium]|nr:hypothetical protein [Terriglobales bacterium]